MPLLKRFESPHIHLAPIYKLPLWLIIGYLGVIVVFLLFLVMLPSQMLFYQVICLQTQRVSLHGILQV